MTDSFWTKVLWSRFIKHFRKLTDEQIIKDIHESMDALEDNDESGDSFGAKMVAWANERRNEKAAVASRENGNLGGRPKKTTEGAENGNNADESTTAFENMRRVPQNEAQAHGFSGGRAAQGTMSRSPEAAAQSGNNFGSAKPSTDGDTRKDSLNMTTVRKNGALESGTSVEKFSSSQNDQRRAGGVSHLSVSTSSRPPARSGAVDVLNLAYAGEFGNVRLTQEQYAQLGIKFGNQQKLNRAIDSLSCQIENGERNPQNHYAELVKWASYRDDMEEKEELKASTAPHYETVSEHNARIVRESDKWIDEHFPPKRKAANG